MCRRTLRQEMADDEQGFSWWLARVKRKLYTYDGKKKRSEDGVLMEKGASYLDLQYYDRYPVNMVNSFRLNEDVYTHEAEGVIYVEDDLKLELIQLRMYKQYDGARLKEEMAALVTSKFATWQLTA